jgi:hypothetical protein
MEYIEINGAINLTDVANQLNAISFIQILMNSFWLKIWLFMDTSKILLQNMD